MVKGHHLESLPDASGLLSITSTVAIPEAELMFEFSRSGGPGGQHVNKVSTRVDLVFDLSLSPSLDDVQKEMIRRALRTRIDSLGRIRLSAQESRSQWKNRQDVVAKLQKLLRQALAIRKRRIPSKPTSGSRERRVTAKKRRSQVKRQRGRISPE